VSPLWKFLEELKRESKEPLFCEWRPPENFSREPLARLYGAGGFGVEKNERGGLSQPGPGDERTRDGRERDLEEAYKRGYEDGYQQGLSAGERSAMGKGLDELKRAASALKKSAQELKLFEDELLELVKEEAAKLAIVVAHKIVKRSMEEDRDVVMRNIEECLKRVGHTRSVTINLHPSDLNYVGMVGKDWDFEFDISFKPLGSITPGGCKVEWHHGKIDATIESQWKRILEELNGKDG